MTADLIPLTNGEITSQQPSRTFDRHNHPLTLTGRKLLLVFVGAAIITAPKFGGTISIGGVCGAASIGILSCLAVGALAGVVGWYAIHKTPLSVDISFAIGVGAAIVLSTVPFNHNSPSSVPKAATPILVSPAPLQDLPASELAKLIPRQGDLSAGYDSGGYISIGCYNGSSWKINELVIEVTVWKPGSEMHRPAPATNRDNKEANLARYIKFLLENTVLIRQYRLTNSDFTNSMSSSSFGTRVGFDLEQGQTWEYSIVSAKGIAAP